MKLGDITAHCFSLPVKLQCYKDSCIYIYRASRFKAEQCPVVTEGEDNGEAVYSFLAGTLFVCVSSFSF